MKTCSKCREAKDTLAFTKNKRCRDGLSSWCKGCVNTHHKSTDRMTAWLSNPENRQRYNEGNKAAWKANNARWRADCVSRSFPQYAKDILEIYKNYPEGHHVDHIVPLKGKLVSGLHVPWNLQYLPASENLKKSNSFSS